MSRAKPVNDTHKLRIFRRQMDSTPAVTLHIAITPPTKPTRASSEVSDPVGVSVPSVVTLTHCEGCIDLTGLGFAHGYVEDSEGMR